MFRIPDIRAQTFVLDHDYAYSNSKRFADIYVHLEICDDDNILPPKL